VQEDHHVVAIHVELEIIVQHILVAQPGIGYDVLRGGGLGGHGRDAAHIVAINAVGLMEWELIIGEDIRGLQYHGAFG